jgi:hypothetical protein
VKPRLRSNSPRSRHQQDANHRYHLERPPCSTLERVVWTLEKISR